MRLPPLLRRRWIAIAWTAAALAGAGAFVYLAVILLGPYPVGPEQPIPISHRVHASTRQISCLFCHDTADRSADAGMPGTEKCLLCHHIIIHNFAPIQKIHEYNERNEAVPWVRVYRLPAYVRFNHQMHLAGGIDCSHCHGDVKRMDRIRQVQKINMGFCIDCHRTEQAPVDCWFCHY